MRARVIGWVLVVSGAVQLNFAISQPSDTTPEMVKHMGALGIAAVFFTAGLIILALMGER